jgi:hypothetical protein
MRQWDGVSGRNLWLLTMAELEQVPDGTLLDCIIPSKEAVKGKDPIDDDTRGGYLAYGVIDPMNHELKDLFLLFMLATK